MPNVVDGDLPDQKLPIVPGHGIVGIVEAAGRPGIPAPGRQDKRRPLTEVNIVDFRPSILNGRFPRI